MSHDTKTPLKEKIPLWKEYPPPLRANPTGKMRSTQPAPKHQFQNLPTPLNIGGGG